MADLRMTTIRLSAEDDSILRRLQQLTGANSVTDVLRLAIRESLRTRGYAPPMPKEGR